MSCTERKRLVALHLKAIADWKEAVQADFLASEQPPALRAWAAALEAEQAVAEHCSEHDCETSQIGLRLAKM